MAVLIASEFMPVSLLTPIAADLGVTEGQTGQAISISGIFAVLTSLFISGLTRRLDRRLVLLAFSASLVLSGAIVTLAPNYPVLMLGRALLGVAIGGFWSMSTSIVMRLLPASMVPKGLAMINAGNAMPRPSRRRSGACWAPISAGVAHSSSWYRSRFWRWVGSGCTCRVCRHGPTKDRPTFSGF